MYDCANIVLLLLYLYFQEVLVVLHMHYHTQAIRNSMCMVLKLVNNCIGLY